MSEKKTEQAFEELSLEERARDLAEVKYKEKTAFVFSCDLDDDCEKAESVIVAAEKHIYKVSERESMSYETVCIPFSDIRDIKFVSYVGYLSIECLMKDSGEPLEICRSSYREKLRMTEAVKWLKIYASGDIPFDKIKYKKKLSCCPVCGRPFAGESQVCHMCADKKIVGKQLFDLSKNHIGKLILTVLLFFCTTALSVVAPNVHRILIDEYIQSPNPGSVLFSGLVFVVIAMAAVSLVSSMLSVISNNILASVSNGIVARLRSELYAKIQMMSIAGISRRSSGELISRVMNDTNQISRLITYDSPRMIEQVLTLLIVGGAMMYSNPVLTILILIPAPLLAVMFRVIWRYTHRLYHRQWLADANASTVLHDIFKGVRVVKVFGTEEREIVKYEKAIREVAEISVRNETVWNLIMPFANFLMGIGSFIVLYYAGSRVLGGTMTLGEMTMFSTYVGILYGPLRWAVSLPRRIQMGLASISKVYEIINEETDVKDASDSVTMEINGDVEFKNVTFGYNDVEDVLKNISFTAKKGEMIGIVGRSGVGKSTLINLIMRLYDVRGGSVTVDGTDIRNIEQSCLRSQMGVVLQETFLFKGTIYANIAYTSSKATREKVIAAAKLANAHEFIMKLPDGYNTYVGENGYTLSGGERQRIAIARAVLNDPKILILDEATSALDTETEKLIQDALAKLIENRTTFAIAHRLSTLRNATKLIVLNEGRLAEIGSHEELMKIENGIYRSLVMAQRQMSKLSKDGSVEE